MRRATIMKKCSAALFSRRVFLRAAILRGRVKLYISFMHLSRIPYMISIIPNAIAMLKPLNIFSHQSKPPTPTTPFFPKLLRQPASNPIASSISFSPIPFWSLKIKALLIMPTSKYFLPLFAFPTLATPSNSLSASSTSLLRAIKRVTAGFVSGDGKRVCMGDEGEERKCGIWLAFGFWS